jgi:hypothetical protein
MNVLSLWLKGNLISQYKIDICITIENIPIFDFQGHKSSCLYIPYKDRAIKRIPQSQNFSISLAKMLEEIPSCKAGLS